MTPALGELEAVDMRGKRVLITGATSGLGLMQAEATQWSVLCGVQHGSTTFKHHRRGICIRGLFASMIILRSTAVQTNLP